MGVNAPGEMKGSIGGGIMEHKFVEMAKAHLQTSGYNIPGEKGHRKIILKKQVHDKAASENQSGMICSGEQTIVLYELNMADATPLENIIHSLSQNENGTLQLSPAGIAFTDAAPKRNFELEIHSETDWIYKEKTGYKNQLFIVGGGHCSLALSALMSSMDFYIRLYDERSALNSIEENDFVHEKHIVSSYSQLSTLIPSGKNHYVVIMTVGYRTDYEAIKALLHKDFKYMGILGSRKKMDKLFAGLETENVDIEKLNQAYTPIGIPIKSQTPEEIAVSIAAEIIMIKNA